jgi:putative transposase
MPDYRRLRTAGATYFFTVNLLNRHHPLLTAHIKHLRTAVRRVRALMPFPIAAWVVLPEHMHALWTLPENDSDFPRRWQAIKMAFPKSIPPGEARSQSRITSGQRGIRQRRYRQHQIRDDRDAAAHMDDIHFNPSKTGRKKRRISSCVRL